MISDRAPAYSFLSVLYHSACLGWEPEDQQYHAMVDNNSVFLECLLDQVKTEQDLRKWFMGANDKLPEVGI